MLIIVRDFLFFTTGYERLVGNSTIGCDIGPYNVHNEQSRGRKASQVLLAGSHFKHFQK